MADLTDKQQVFVAEYLQDLNAAAAAIRAGYSERTARQQGARLLTNADIVEGIRQQVEQRLKGAGVTTERVMAELEKVAYGDMGDYLVFLDNGQVRLDFSKARGRTGAIASIDQDVQLTGAKSPPILKTRVRLCDKVKALGELLRYIEVMEQRKTADQQSEEADTHVPTRDEEDREWADEIEKAAAYFGVTTVADLCARLRGEPIPERPLEPGMGAAADGADRGDG